MRMPDTKGNVLIVDDEPNAVRVLSAILGNQGYSILESHDATSAVNVLGHNEVDAVITDIRMPGDDGLYLYDYISEKYPQIPVIFLTAYGTVDSAVHAILDGAFYYFIKPPDYEKLKSILARAVEQSCLKRELEYLRKKLPTESHRTQISGSTPEMLRILQTIEAVRDSESSTLICGETGTGKELIAKTLHYSSIRSDRPFVPVNCAAIPRELMESELFGYEKGAFTGADKNKKGLIAEASFGTFFLDEISEMPLSMQVKVLRVLEEKEFYSVGGRQIVKMNARIIAASNKNLEQEVKNGQFREDLYYRIHVIPIKLPTLNERKEDIPILARHFLKKHSEEMGKNINAFSTDAMQKLISYPWPGNIRELENTIECAMAMAKGNIITEDLILQTQNVPPESLKSFKDAKENFEKNYLIQLFELTKGNVSQAAKLAGKYRADVYELIKKYNIKLDDFRET